jgi:peptidoglycan/LPS O-acetylase OafA/YrhL
MTEGKIRIKILDGFRAIAIISVMHFHYFSRWTPPNNKFALYPYGNLYDYFELGKLGVQFFFIISGFVIYFTLEKTLNIASFWRNRMIRLLPSIIVASIITFFFFSFIDKNNIFPSSHLIKNFIPSISFISPSIFNNIFDTNLNYINGSYWSLWPEIQFYFLSSCIYFINKKRFVLNFMIISIVLISTNYAMQNIQGSNKLNIEISENILTWYETWIFNGFNLINYLPFFSIGIISYILYKNNKDGIRTSLFLRFCISFIILFTVYSGVRMLVRLVYILMISMFFIFIYFPQKLSPLENSKITNIGKSSYFLYLIHENIGVFIIYTLGQYILPNSFIIPIILIIGLSYLSILFTNKFDKPINKFLKKKIIMR